MRVRILGRGAGESLALDPGGVRGPWGSKAFSIQESVIRGWASLSPAVPLRAGVSIPEASLHPFPGPAGSVRGAAQPPEPGGTWSNPCAWGRAVTSASWEGRKVPLAADAQGDKFA